MEKIELVIYAIIGIFIAIGLVWAIASGVKKTEETDEPPLT